MVTLVGDTMALVLDTMSPVRVVTGDTMALVGNAGGDTMSPVCLASRCQSEQVRGAAPLPAHDAHEASPLERFQGADHGSSVQSGAPCQRWQRGPGQAVATIVAHAVSQLEQHELLR